MSANTWDKQSYYYSGQGVMLIGDRDANGNPKGLIPVGNVSDLKIQIAATVIEHKESQTGQRAIDLRLTTELKGQMSVTMENFNAVNLALATRGDAQTFQATTGTSETQSLYNTRVVAMQRINVANVVVKRGSTTLTAYTNDQTPYDYKLNAAAGSIEWNPGNVVAMDKVTTGGTAPSAITVGTTTQVTVANTASVGDFVVFTGFAGADAALVNGVPAQILAASPTSVTININTNGKTITLGTPLSAFDGTAITVTYDYGLQQQVNGLTQAAPTKWVRFEGLNTADGNNPVVIEVFKFMTDPLKELSMISDKFEQFVLDGNFLYDGQRSVGSKFFREIALR